MINSSSSLDRDNDFAIGLILYHPEESLLKRVDQMVGQGYKVYVFDNSPFVSDCSIVVQGNQNICYLTAGRNVGIGLSLAILCATAYTQGFSRLLFLDQDTGISSKTLDFISAFTQATPNEVHQQYAAMVFTNKKSNDHKIQDVRLAINSGSLFNLSVLKNIGWHSDKFFVDGVDYELCVRARRLGYKIGLIGGVPDFDHVSEQPDRMVKIFGKDLLVRRYSVSRVLDAASAYTKLIIGGALINKLSDTIFLFKSAFVYFFGQILVRIADMKN